MELALPSGRKPLHAGRGLLGNIHRQFLSPISEGYGKEMSLSSPTREKFRDGPVRFRRGCADSGSVHQCERRLLYSRPSIPKMREGISGHGPGLQPDYAQREVCLVGERGTVVRNRKRSRPPPYERGEHQFPGLPRPPGGYPVEADGKTGPVEIVGRVCGHEARENRPLSHGHEMERVQGEARIPWGRVREQGEGVRKTHRTAPTRPVSA